MVDEVKPPQIYGLMSKIMFEIGSIKKAKTNTHFNYKFRGIDDVMNALHPHLATNGVFFVPKVVSHQVSDRGGKNHTALVMSYTFFAPDGSSIEAEMPAEGLDQGGDKATNKALSAALKYLLLQVFCIPTEDMEESDFDGPQQKRTAERSQPGKSSTTSGSSPSAQAGSNSAAKPSQPTNSTSTPKETVKEICRELNALGDTIKWTPAATNKFVVSELQVANGIDDLNDAGIKQLLRTLSLRLDKLRQSKEGN
jgi:hypothetical protein